MALIFVQFLIFDDLSLLMIIWAALRASDETKGRIDAGPGVRMKC